MTAPDKSTTAFVTLAFHEKEIADRDREIAELKVANANYAALLKILEDDQERNERVIAELQSKLDLMADDPGAQYFMGIAEGQRIYEKLKGQPFQVVDSPELAMLRDQVAKLQARLKACPTVDQLRYWGHGVWDGDAHGASSQMLETANRMEALNDR